MTEICRVRTLPFPFAILALALALALAIGCTAAEEEAPPQPPLVVLAPVDGRDLEEHIEATGQLLAVDEADIAAEVEGRITEILADEGDPVEEGGEILLIDPERRELELADARAQVAEARASHSEARRERSRGRRPHTDRHHQTRHHQ